MQMTSGKLVVENFFCLTDGDVVAKARHDDAVKKKHNEEKELRTTMSKNKDEDKFKQAARNFFADRNLLKDD